MGFNSVFKGLNSTEGSFLEIFFFTYTFLSRPVQTGPGAHPACCTVGTGSFPGIKSSRGVALTPHPLLVPWSWKSRAIPLLPLWAVRPVQSLSALQGWPLPFSSWTTKQKIKYLAQFPINNFFLKKISLFFLVQVPCTPPPPNPDPCPILHQDLYTGVQHKSGPLTKPWIFHVRCYL